MMPLGLGARSFQACQDPVMRIVCGQVQAKIESRRALWLCTVLGP